MDVKYYAFVVKTYNDGTADKTSSYVYDNLDDAIALAHTQFGQNVGADTIAAIMSTVFNSYGVQYTKHTLFWSEATDVSA